MRKKILAGNWKMNFTKSGAEDFLANLQSTPAFTVPYPKAEMRIYASPLFLDSLVSKVNTKKVVIGAQNCHQEKSGAFTGEVSAEQLASIGIQHTLIGHSERRQYFGETDQSVYEKCLALLPQNFDILLCIGETLQERETGQTWKVLQNQLTKIVSEESGSKFRPYLGKTLHIAYEPVWAIGTGKTASPEQAEEVHSWIRKFLIDHGIPNANEVSILYGGSVSPTNFVDLLKCPNIDGGLVGGASLKLDSWINLWTQINSVH